MKTTESGLYVPENIQEIDHNLAKLMVLNADVQPDQNVLLLMRTSALPLVGPLVGAVIGAGAHPHPVITHEGIEHQYYGGSLSQITTHPMEILLAQVNWADQFLQVDSTQIPEQLENIPSEHKSARRKAKAPYIAAWWGKVPLMYAMRPTDLMAESSNLTPQECWADFIAACHLDNANPVAKWMEINRQKTEITEWLNQMPIEQLRIQGASSDLIVAIGKGRQWIHAGKQNFPSVEIYTSPDARGTEGWMRFNEPFSWDGVEINNVELSFENGRVTRFNADTAEQKAALLDFLNQPGADRLGEISLTDKRFAPIRTRIKEPLFVENIGGKKGNCHLACGNSYVETYNHPHTEEEAKALGFNGSPEHEDMISTEDRTVTAILSDGTEVIIYRNGMFTRN